MRSLSLTLAAAISTVMLAGAGPVVLGDGHGGARTPVRVQMGSASWYGGAFHGRRTAYGERFDRSKMTLASRSLPYNTRVRVTCLRTGKSCIARVTDYGPNGHCRRRIADLSEAAADAVGLKSSGVAKVKIEVLGSGTSKKEARSKPAPAKLVKTAADESITNKTTSGKVEDKKGAMPANSIKRTEPPPQKPGASRNTPSKRK